MINDFVLKNGHRNKALALAVSLMATNRAEAARDDVLSLRTDIIRTAETILTYASRRHDDFEDFVAEGVATQQKILRLNTLEIPLQGLVGIPHENTAWPRLLQRFELGAFEGEGIDFVPATDVPPPTLAKPVIHFPNASGRGRLPMATLYCATHMDVSMANQEIKKAQSRLQTMVTTTFQSRIAALKAVYEDIVPAIAMTINEVKTSHQLVDRFPAARALFEEEAKSPSDDRTAQLLRTLA